eukprot:397097-Rhodomonas_salina.2
MEVQTVNSCSGSVTFVLDARTRGTLCSTIRPKSPAWVEDTELSNADFFSSARTMMSRGRNGTLFYELKQHVLSCLKCGRNQLLRLKEWMSRYTSGVLRRTGDPSNK